MTEPGRLPGQRLPLILFFNRSEPASSEPQGHTLGTRDRQPRYKQFLIISDFFDELLWTQILFSQVARIKSHRRSFTVSCLLFHAQYKVTQPCPKAT